MTTPHRDLALVDHWQRSLERSHHRRAITPAIRRSLARRRRASVALSTLMVAGPTGSLLAAAGFGLGGPRVDVAQASPANRAIDDGATPAGMAFKLGSHGDAVAEIQRQLGVAADGFFGPVTHQAVLGFQARNGLDVDGVVGPATWTALFGLEQAAAAAGARDGNVAVIVRERGAEASAASVGDDSTADGDGGPAGSGAGDQTSGFGGDQPATVDRGGQPGSGTGQAGDGGSGGAGRETLAVGGDLPDSNGGTPPADDAPATKPVSTPPAGNGACGRLRLASPVKGMVTSGFGPRWGRNHDGLDIAAPTGTPIRAAECGIVSFAGVQSGYGNMVCVKHSSRFETCYAHMTKYAVSQGQRVNRGQVIGYVGCTGNCTGPHLHFETRVDGAARDPRPYLGGGAVPGAPTVKAATTSKARVATAAAIAKDVKQARIAAATVTASTGATGSAGGATGAWSSVDSQPTGSPATTAAPIATTGSAPDTAPAPDPSTSAPAPAPTAPTPTTVAPAPTPTYEAPQPTYSAPEPAYSAPAPAPAPVPSAPATPAPEPTYEPPASTAPTPPAPAEPTTPAPTPAAETTAPAPPAPTTPTPEPSAPAPDPATEPVTEAPTP